MTETELKNIIEAAMLAAGKPLTMENLLALFDMDDAVPHRDDVKNVLAMLEADYEDRGIELKQVASGYRIQVRSKYANWMGRLWAEKPARYSRALLETLALIAYRQPITRAEIEDVRGVSVSSNIVRTLLEREWIRVVGHRDVPGKPAMYGTTREFLDYFNLKSLGDLPTLAEIRDLDEITGDLFRQGGELDGKVLPGIAVEEHVVDSALDFAEVDEFDVDVDFATEAEFDEAAEIDEPA